MTYRELKAELLKAFDQVNNSSFDNEVASEDKEHLTEIINK